MSTPTGPQPKGRGRRWLDRLRRPQSLSPDASFEVYQRDQDLVMSLSTKRIPSWRQLRGLPAVLRPAEKNWLRFWLSIAAVSLIVFLVALFTDRLTTVAKAGGTLTEGLVGAPQTINPILARPTTVDAELVSLTFRGLMRVNRNFTIVPDLAASVTTSEDGKTITVVLRKNLLWSDNQPLNTDDVIYTFQTMADAQFKSPWASSLRGVTVERKDDRTAIFHLTNRNPNFTSLLTLGLVPQHAWGDQTGTTLPLAELNLKPISNGPYRFSSLTKDRNGSIKSMMFVRSKTYAGTAPYLDRMVVKFYGDRDSAIQALASSSVDSLGDLRLPDLSIARKHGSTTNLPIAQLNGVFFNQRTNPALKSRDVRYALSMAVNRSNLVSGPLKGQARAAASPIVPGSLGYNSKLKQFSGQADQAKALLDQAGWKLNAKNIRQKGTQQLTFVLTTIDDPQLSAVANALAKTWGEIGAQVQVKIVEASRFERDVVQPRSYEALLFGQRYGDDGDPYLYWDSEQQRDPGFGLAIFYDKNLDKDLEDARATTDLAAKIKDYQDFQNIVADQAPAIILFQSVYSYVHPKNLRGLNTQGLVGPANRFDDVANWYLKTRLTFSSKKG